MGNAARLQSLKKRLFIALSGAVIAVLILQNAPFLRAVFLPLNQLTATITFMVIGWFGAPVALDDVILSHPDGFRVAIDLGCTPLPPSIFIGILLLFGLSLSWRQRLVGLTSAVLLITLLNHCRLTALYYVGVHAPGAFSSAHNWIGQGLIVIATASVVVYWIAASAQRQLETLKVH